MYHHDYEGLSRQIDAGICYDSISKHVADAIIPFDMRVRLEDQIKLRFLSLARGANNRTFAYLVRRVRNERPRWMQRKVLEDMVAEELSIRLMMAKIDELDALDRVDKGQDGR